MELEYLKNGDYYIPNIELGCKDTKVNLGKYGRLREKYLREHKPYLFEHLKMSERLISHLASVDKEAKAYEEVLIKQFAKKENVDEKLKATNQLEWVQSMNSIKQRVQEIVCNEMIYN